MTIIRFENPPQPENSIDPEEFTAIKEMLEERLQEKPQSLGWKIMASLQIEGYGEDIHPKDGFERRFDATLEALRLHFIGKNLYISGSYSLGDPYYQPYDCWDLTLSKYSSPEDSYLQLLWDFPLADIIPAASSIKKQLESELTEEQLFKIKDKISKRPRKVN